MTKIILITLFYNVLNSKYFYYAIETNPYSPMKIWIGLIESKNEENLFAFYFKLRSFTKTNRLNNDFSLIDYESLKPTSENEYIMPWILVTEFMFKKKRSFHIKGEEFMLCFKKRLGNNNLTLIFPNKLIFKKLKFTKIKNPSEDLINVFTEPRSVNFLLFGGQIPHTHLSIQFVSTFVILTTIIFWIINELVN